VITNSSTAPAIVTASRFGASPSAAPAVAGRVPDGTVPIAPARSTAPAVHAASGPHTLPYSTAPSVVRAAPIAAGRAAASTAPAVIRASGPVARADATTPAIVATPHTGGAPVMIAATFAGPATTGTAAAA
jgi:hypothetical protein